MDTSPHIPVAQPLLGEEERQAVLAVLESGQLAQGRVVAEFERHFAEWCGVRHAVAVSSGTAALHTALLAHGIGAGDEVITSPFTFIASANAALFVGARPVFVDVDPDTFCLDPELVEAAITPRTRAILPVHLYGYPTDMPRLQEIARRHDLLLVEDACQAHGASVYGRKVGAIGDSGVFSLYPTKNITSGEGGFLTTDSDAVAEQAHLIRSHGASERYRHDVLGYNFRLSDVHAAIGLAQLSKIDEFNAARRRNAAYLSRALAGVEGIRLPIEQSGFRHVYHQYTIRVLDGRRDVVQQELTHMGVGSSIHYPLPIHKQPLYQRLGYADQEFPVTERLAAEVLSLPVHPGLAESDLERIVRAITQISLPVATA